MLARLDAVLCLDISAKDLLLPAGTSRAELSAVWITLAHLAPEIGR